MRRHPATGYMVGEWALLAWTDRLTRGFDAERERLHAVAFRMLGSSSEAEDAVQEAWLRLGSVDATEIGNLRGWLTTVVSRVALDMLRARKARREERLVAGEIEPILNRDQRADPEQEAVLAEAVGIGLLVVLDRLEPSERLAFVLHDIFGVSFADIAPIVGRSPVAARKLASRARRRLRGASEVGEADLERQRRVVGAFFAASREGDFAALLEVLDPDATLHVDPEVTASGEPAVATGAAAIAKRAQFGAAARGQSSQLMLVDGGVGIVVAPFGHVRLVMQFQVADDRIYRIDIVTDLKRLAGLQIGLLGDS